MPGNPCRAVFLPLLLLAASTACSAASQCVVNIQGSSSGNNSSGGVSSAYVVCTGGEPVALAANQRLLGSFKSSFQGVAWDDSCSVPSCLLSFCSGSSSSRRVVLSSSSITGVSSPEIRAVLCVSGAASVTLQDSTLARNNATAIFARGRASVLVRASNLSGNAAQGPGVSADASASLVSIEGHIEHMNAAGNVSGGAVAAVDSSRVTITDGSRLDDNSCTALGCVGGAVFVAGQAAVVVEGRSRVENNTALLAGGGLAALGTGSMVIRDGSRVCGNVAVNGSGGGVFCADSVRLTVTGRSSVCNNSCPYGSGGGVLVQGNAHMELSGSSSVCYNKASQQQGFGKTGGGIMLVFNASLLVTGHSSIRGNAAGVGGGGVALLYRSRALITGGSSVSNNTSLADQALSFGRGGAGLLVYGNSTCVLTGGSRITGNRAIDTSGGGIFVASRGNLTVGEGVQFSDNAVSPGYAGTDIATFSHATFSIDPSARSEGSPLTKCSRSVFLGRVPCGVGEHGSSGICACCEPSTFDLEGGDSPCLDCPDNAVCPGGSVILPMAGFWHSSNRSVQMHRCPLHTAACGPDGTCQAGYRGNLCGACQQGYGIASSMLKCRKCLPHGLQLGLYILVSCVTVVFVAVTVRLTWQDNKQGGDAALKPSDCLKILVQFLQYLIILSSISVPWPSFMLAVYSAASVVFGAASGAALSLDCIVEQHTFFHGRLPVAIQRQLFFFIAAVVNFVAVALLLIATHWVKRGWRAATASSCRSRRHSTRSQVLAPPGVGRGSGTSLHGSSAVAPTPALGATPQRNSQGFDYTKLLVAVPVVLFYAFPTLVKAALTFFACLRIDDAAGPYPAYAVASHPSGYWTADIQQECFTGVHKTWALALGVPAVLLFCVVLPVGMFVFLWVNRFKVDDPEYRKYFGFVYRNYTVSKCWWEAVWATQTVLLTAVAVFHFTLTAYSALLLLGLLLLASTVLQTVAKPYALHQLHRQHMASTLCLILNVWCALAFFSCAGSQATRAPSCFPNWNTAVGVIMVVVNIGFVVWCLYDVLISALPALQSFRKTASSVSSGVLQAASARLRLPRRRRRTPRRLLGAQRVDSDALPRLWDQIQRRCADAADGADAEAPDGGALNGGLMPVQSAPARMAGG